MYFRKKNMQSFIKSFFYALSGVCYSWSIGWNFRIQIVLGVVAFSLCFAYRVERWEWIVVSILTGGVLALETLNSAVEKLCNHITLEQDPSIKKIKDLSAGAVLIFSFFALVIGCLIFIPRIISIFS